MYAKLVGKYNNKQIYMIFCEDNTCMFYARRQLKEMPLDRWDSDHFVHATGYEYFDYGEGKWVVEYEDDLFPEIQRGVA